MEDLSNDESRRSNSDEEFDPQEMEEEELDESYDEEKNQEREIKRMRKMKQSQNEYMNEIRKSSRKSKKVKNDTSSEDKMKELISQAEKLATFLLSKHRMNAGDPRDANTIRRKKTKSVKKEDVDVLRNDSGGEIEEDDNHEFIRLTRQPSLIKGGVLKDYQMIGLNWLISLYEIGINGILADQMGLGKTIQTIAFLAFLKEMKKISGPHLIVGPNSTVGNWCKELKKWVPSFRVVKLYARKEYREEIYEKQLIPGKFDVCVTSYEGINICLPKLKKFNWRYIIIDEAHRLKNEMSVLSKNLRVFKTDLKLLITGTPLQNNLHELWSLLNFLLPELFDDSDVFDNWFSLNNNDELNEQEAEKKNVQIINSLHRILRPFILRRTKEDMAKSLPPKKEIQLYIGLTQTQVEIYKNILIRKSFGKDKKFYMNVLMQLRKACNHPYLFDGIEEEGAPILGKHIIDASGKLRVLDKLLVKLHKGHQVLIFSQMTSMLNILEDYCRFRNFKYCRIDGETMIEDRERQIEEFTDEGSDIFIFLLSTRAGGLGINLATADTVILYDSDWNPQVDLQAMDRAHRIGQKNPVNVYRFITENTIEEKIIERQLVKLKWDLLVIQKGRLAQKTKGMNKNELKELINHGASEIFKAVDGTFNEHDIEDLLKRGEERTVLENDRIDKSIQDKVKNISDLGVSSINVYEFEGDDYQKKKKDDKKIVQKAQKTREKKKTLATRRSAKTTDYIQFEKKVIKMPKYHLYQNRERMMELLNKENDLKYNAMIMRDQRQIVPESFERLDDEEEKEKDRLIDSGFTSWTKNDFLAFVRGNELYGRQNFEKITQKVKTKSIEEVKEYSKRFWELINTIEDGEKYRTTIEKGEEILDQKKKNAEIISEKCKGCFTYDDIEFNPQVYNKFRSRLFTLEHDKFLLFSSSIHGYMNYKVIRASLKTESSFEFDHYLKSRSEGDLNKRMNSLLKVIQAEKVYPDEKIETIMIKTSNDIAKKARILRFGKAYQKEYEKTQRKKSGFKRPKPKKKTTEEIEKEKMKLEEKDEKFEKGRCLNLEKRAPEADKSHNEIDPSMLHYVIQSENGEKKSTNSIQVEEKAPKVAVTTEIKEEDD